MLKTLASPLKARVLAGRGKENGPENKKPRAAIEEGADVVEADSDDDNDFEAALQPARKQPRADPAPTSMPSAAQNTSDDDEEDAIEDSDIKGAAMNNAFLAFARPGKKPAAALNAVGRPSRAAAAAASRRTARALKGEDSEEVLSDEDDERGVVAPGHKKSAAAAARQQTKRQPAPQQRRPSRAAAEKANKRLRRDSMEEEEEDDDAEAADEESEEEMEDGASSEGDEEASSSSGDEDVDEEEAEVDTRAARRRTGTAAASAGPSTRPSRACVVRAAARASSRKASLGSSDDDDGEEEAEKDAAAAGQPEESGDVVVIDGSSEDGEKPVQGGRAQPPRRSRLRHGGGAAATAAAAAAGAEAAEDEDPDAAALEDSDVEMQEAGSGDDDVDGNDDSEEEDTSEDSAADEDGGRARKRAKTGAAKAKAKPAGKAAAAAKAAKGKQQPVCGGGSERSKAREAAAAGKPREAVERILSYDSATDTYLVKLEGVSYRQLARVSTAFLEAKRGSMLRAYLSRGRAPVEVDPEWTQVDRVIAERTVNRGRGAARARQLLVKWRGLEYGEATWEEEDELAASEADKAAIERFERFNHPAKRQGGGGAAGGDGPSLRKLRQKDFELPEFCSGRKLRDYQEVSVRWMVNNFVQSRNCILGDEMGLGKTAQSTSCLQTLRQVGGVQGPFLIVAPLTTLGHWQREVQTWTDMNVVLFAGSAADRAVILEHEFYHTGPSSSRAALLGGGRGAKQVKFHVLLTSYETLRQEKSLFKTIPWAAAVFDEAHKLKGINSSTRATVQELDIRWLLLLTGTPIQNNMTELYSILSLLDPAGYPSLEDFNARFGGAGPGQPPSVAQIKKLQESLAPILLRRMKEDVEELPQKEEVVIWVELSQQQRAYYRALYEGCIGALLGGGSAKNLPQMRNLAMELRKLCCHPVLCEGLEDDLRTKLAQQRSAAEAAAAAEGHAPDTEFKCPETELLVRGSGKMTLLHKLLPKLRAEGKRVLIFSQFVVMLDVLEDYCTLMGYPVERIDGTIKGRQRQQAIDRFSAADADHDSAFVFLLSTRAGGQGITLTAADTCIIYDSDWNPQNDLQAMARCHRIGQTKEVTVYRLISNDTYEMALFSSASRKYGLDEAVLGFAAGTDPEADSARIADLLRNGAHGLLGDMEAGAKKGEAFAGEDINQILEGRTERRQIGSRAGNTFSVATFAVDDAPGGGGGDGLPPRRRGRGAAAAEDEAEKEYWRALLPDAVANHENRVPEAAVVLGPRKRTKVCYNVDAALKKRYANESDSDSDFENEPGKDSGGSGSGSGAEGASGSDGGAKEGAAAAAGKKRRRSAKRAAAEGGEAGAGGEGGEEGAAAEGAGAEGGKGGKGRGRRPAANWSKAEVKALEDLVGGIGGDRWDVVYEAMQPTKRSAAEVEEAGRALWALYGRAVEIARQRMLGKVAVMIKAVDEEDDKMEPELKKEASDAPGQADAGIAQGGKPTDGAAQQQQQQPEGAAGVAGAGAGAAAGGTAAAAGTDGLDEHDLLLLAELNNLPESLRGVLAVPATVLRFRKEGAFFMTHMKEMMELAAWVLPEVAKRQEAAAATAAAPDSSAPLPGSQPLVPHIPVSDKSGLPGWWSRAEDEALLIAAAQVGYMRGRPGRTLAQALKSGHLATRLADVMPLAPAPAAGGEEDVAAAEGKSGKGKAKADKGGAADGGAGDDDVVMLEVEPPVDKKQDVEAAAAKPEEGSSGDKPEAQSQRMTQDEFKVLQRAMGQRLSKVIDKATTFRKQQAHRAKAPLPLSHIKPPATLQPQRQQQQQVTVAGATIAAPAMAAAARKSLPPSPGKKPVEQSRSPVKPVTATAAAAKPAATAAPAAKPPVAASTANAAAPVPAALAAVEAKKAASPAAAGDTAVKPVAPTAGGAAGAAAGKKKQSILPFARLSSGGAGGSGGSKLKKPEPAPAVVAAATGIKPLGKAAGSTTPTKNIKSAAAAVPEPGSAERPIELDDSE